MRDETPLDLAIIGGGLAGLIHLHYARRAGLQALVLERESGVGGLWRRLPAWQDLQVSLADFVVGDLALAGPMQPQVLAYVESWVERFALADGIRVDSPVHRARHTGSCWELDTPAGTVRARHLVAATGAHNKPMIPAVARRDSTVREFHSSALRDPANLEGSSRDGGRRRRLGLRPARPQPRAGCAADRVGLSRRALVLADRASRR